MYSDEKLSTGNLEVDEIGKMDIRGNVIPVNWYKMIVYKNGKPNLNAIVILSDIVYWYRPTKIKDEATGKVIGIKKKFKSDKLQKSYNQFCNQYGLSKQQVTDAVVFLENLGIIKREFRTGVLYGQKCANLLYIDINPQILYKMTYPQNKGIEGEISVSVSNGKGIGIETDTTYVSGVEELSTPKTEFVFGCEGVDKEKDTLSVSNGGDMGIETDTLSVLNVEGVGIETDTLSVLNGIDVGLNRDTNTYIIQVWHRQTCAGGLSALADKLHLSRPAIRRRLILKGVFPFKIKRLITENIYILSINLLIPKRRVKLIGLIGIEQSSKKILSMKR